MEEFIEEQKEQMNSEKMQFMRRFQSLVPLGEY